MAAYDFAKFSKHLHGIEKIWRHCSAHVGASPKSPLRLYKQDRNLVAMWPANNDALLPWVGHTSLVICTKRCYLEFLKIAKIQMLRLFLRSVKYKKN